MGGARREVDEEGFDPASSRCWRTQSIARSVMSVMKW